MGSINKCLLVGRVGRDPETRNTQDGGKIVNISLATSESWRDKQSGERRERTEWHRVVIFNERVAEIAEKYVRKGSMIGIEGSLQTRKWTDQAGVEKYSTEIVITKFRGELTLLDSKRDGDERDAAPAAGRSGGYPPEGGAAQRRPAGADSGMTWDRPKGGGMDDDSEIPF